MTYRRLRAVLADLLDSRTDLLALTTLLVSVIPRLLEATSTYLNPDEASYFSMAVADTIPTIYERSLHTHHPPLFVFILALTHPFTHSELALRAVPVLAGTVFPWFIYRWLGLVWNKLAGYLALLILAFSPFLIGLSAEARGYTLALLGVAASLYLLERAIRESSPALMAASAGALYVAIVSEYFTAFYAPAAGLYFIARVWGTGPRRSLLVSWVAAQAGGVALYVLLYLTHISRIAEESSSSTAMEGFLRGGFPWPGDNPLVFLIAACAKQFMFLFSSIPLGAAMILPFLLGLWLLWRGQSAQSRGTHTVILLVLLPFLAAAAGAFLRVHPFTRSRHTVVIGLFVAAAIAISFERLLRDRKWLVLPGALALIALWHSVVGEPPNTVPGVRHEKARLHDLVEHMRATVPQGATILCDDETKYIVDYYLGPGEPPWAHRVPGVSGWSNRFRLVSYRYSFQDDDQVLEDLASARREYNLGSEDIWLVEGGWILRRFQSPKLQPLVAEEQNFGRAITLYRMRVAAPRYPALDSRNQAQ